MPPTFKKKKKTIGVVNKGRAVTSKYFNILITLCFKDLLWSHNNTFELFKREHIRYNRLFLLLVKKDKLQVIRWQFLNGMLRHSLASLEGEQEFLVFYRALLPLGCSPLSFLLQFFISFFHFNCVHAHLQ